MNRVEGNSEDNPTKAWGITVVKTKQDAMRVVEILNQSKDQIHAWDLKAKDISFATQSPVGNGSIICASCFIGLKEDFGNGPRLFIDNRDDVISEFKVYFEDESLKKSWRNYSFSRHILYNHGIDAKGL